MSSYDRAQNKQNSYNDSSKWLWCGGSVFCICGHHVENHYTNEARQVWGLSLFYCKTDCKCEEFRSYKKKD